MTNEFPPFDPPYKTFEQTPEGLHVIETLADGTTRIVPTNETSRPPRRSQPVKPRASSTASAPPVSSGSAAKPIVQPLAQGNDRAVMYLNVPFAEKDMAKGLGAKWDGAMRKWYMPHGVDVNLFSRWWPDTLKQEMKPFGQL